MTADDFLWLANQVVLLAVAVVVIVEAVRRPSKAATDIAAFFGAIAIAILLSDLGRALGEAAPRLLATLTAVPVVALPYLLLRVADDLRPQPGWLMIASAATTVVLVIAWILLSPPTPAWLLVGVACWFILLGGYVSATFIRGSRLGSGVTARRMLAAATGALLLAAVIGLAVVAGLVPAIADPVTLLFRILTMGAAVAFFVGFATPAFLRRAWQEPELRSFLERAASLPRLPDTESIIAELERGAAASTGAPHAVIGLWDGERNLLVYRARDGSYLEFPADAMIGGRAFSQQRAVFSPDATRDDPAWADRYERSGANAILAAPIRAGSKRLGVLCVYAERAPVFASDDLSLVQLLADQAAVILESRALIDEASRVRAREEATRLKDDFLSTAAHDLRTPLTTILIQAQLLQRSLQADPSSPADPHRIETIVREALRLRELVSDYLDAARAERGELVDARPDVDLRRLAEEACRRHATRRHPCRMEAPEAVVGTFDPDRVAQLLDNLLSNAIKYSPEGGAIVVRVWTEGDQARLSVTDSGIGIPLGDLPHLFDRFHRGSNVDDRRFHGLGLGLYICRGIVEQHGGRIWATSQRGRGTTLHVELPRVREVAAEAVETDAPELTVDPSPTAEAGAGG